MNLKKKKHKRQYCKVHKSTNTYRGCTHMSMYARHMNWYVTGHSSAHSYLWKLQLEVSYVGDSLYNEKKEKNCVKWQHTRRKQHPLQCFPDDFENRCVNNLTKNISRTDTGRKKSPTRKKALEITGNIYMLLRSRFHIYLLVFKAIFSHIFQELYIFCYIKSFLLLFSH